MLSDLPQRFGAYVLLRPLGEGGMGSVYLAMSGHREMETLCVVKRLLPELASQPDPVQRFRHEADLARRLVHSNLAHTHNIGEVDGEVFLVQEFVEGRDVSALLAEMAARGRRIPVPVAVYIAGELARGLSYAHAFENLELVHRDINPPNVRITYAGEVKLLDFGIASSNLHDRTPGENPGAGKLWHLAPEQVLPGAAAESIDRRTDIYAVGLVLWELLTQRPPGTVIENRREFRTPETEAEILVWIARGQHQAPSAFNPEVPERLDALLAKALHPNRDFRHNSADELRRELSSFIPAEVHPEQELASLVKEIFSPESERGERRTLIEAARHLLDAEARPAGRSGELPKQSSGDPPKASASRLSQASKRLPMWLVPVAIGAVVGLVALVSFRLALAPGEPTSARASAPPALMLLPASTTVLSAGRPETRPNPAPPAPQPARTVASAPLAPSAPNTPPVPAKPAADNKERKPIAASTAKHSDGETPSSDKPDHVDHLNLAREAFNARDWPRALAEGKSALASGGGADAHAILGNTYFKMGRFTDAESAYAKASALDPNNSLLRERLRIAHARAQDDSAGKEP